MVCDEGKKLSSDAHASLLIGHMKTGELKILRSCAEKFILQGSESHQGFLLKGSQYGASGFHSVLQALGEIGILLLAPVFSEGDVLQYPASFVLSVAPVHFLIAVEGAEQSDLKLCF